MYAFGDGVPQDYVSAHMWFNVFPTSGSEDDPQIEQELLESARSNRGKLEVRMSNQQIEDAQLRARVCILSDYQDCGDISVAKSNNPRQYQSLLYGWSILVPAGWLVDPSDRAFVKLHPPNQFATCGIHSAETKFTSSDDFAEFMQDYMANLLKNESGLTSRATSKEVFSIPSGQDCIRVTTELEPGGRSMRMYCALREISFAIDCEAAVVFWDSFSDDFANIHSSFTIE